jgi:hypothetical protein
MIATRMVPRAHRIRGVKFLIWMFGAVGHGQKGKLHVIVIFEVPKGYACHTSWSES